VGRIRHLNRVSPLVLAIVRTESGARVDAVMVDENDVSRVFGFTRAYFHVNTSDPTAVIGFVKSIIPLKPVAELYTALGWNQHGKTALYRGLRRHLDNSADRFELTRGARGMVMVVFSLPSFDVVFKVIRDSFDPPKQTTRRQVKEKYRLVFDHDRAGRMVDAQEFEHLALPRDRFVDDVLDQLTQLAPSAVTINDEHVVLHHVYTERRVHPLDLYLAEVGTSRGRRAVTDYGQAIKDLAAADIFPGDLFTKNFGVTRHGTVVFYDYDEIMRLGACRIRELPQARNEEDELRSEPWFSVAQNDVFPTEFRRFLRFGNPELQAAFDEQHSDLWTTEFWRRIQRRHAQGDPPPVFPYPAATRLT
jgi:isocitrate dehydrogenase kinase/phosphatase